MRIYHNYSSLSDDWKILNENFGRESNVQNHVDLCNVSQISYSAKGKDHFAMTWRFITLLDDTVDIFISRDSDSLIAQREIGAVREW